MRCLIGVSLGLNTSEPHRRRKRSKPVSISSFHDHLRDDSKPLRIIPRGLFTLKTRRAINRTNYICQRLSLLKLTTELTVDGWYGL